MVRKFFKKTSKRVSTRTRTKIERKVKAHNKKLRRDAKKNPQSHRKKKDPGIPNSLPSKDLILKEAEDRKIRLEEERVKQKERRKKNRAKAMDKRRGLETLVKDAQKRSDDFDKKNAFVTEKIKDYTGGKSVELSLKQYYKEFRKVIDAADVILEVLDARDPLGSRCPQVEEAVMEAGAEKKLVLILNKIDLVPKENVEKWLKYLRNEFPAIAFKASTQTQHGNLSHIKVPVAMATDDLRKSSRCLGAEMLMKLLGNYCRKADIKTAIRVGVVGFPNTGKSSLINSLKRSKSCGVGATPGVTKTMQEVQLDKNVKLLDCPGIVMASADTDSSTILRNCVKLESLVDPIQPVAAILRRCNKHQMMMQYGLPDYCDVNDFLSLLAQRRGQLRKGGRPDINKAARSVLQDWNTGKLTFYTHPPEIHTMPTHIKADIVTKMSQEFDIDALLNDEEETLKGLKQTSAMDIVVDSEGPTAGKFSEASMAGMGGKEDSSEEEEEDMEDDCTEEKELKNITIKSTPARSRRSSSTLVEEKKKIDREMTLKGNLQVLKNKKKELKKQKKQRNKADRLAGQLSDELSGALAGLGGGTDEDYDFATDFK